MLSCANAKPLVLAAMLTCTGQLLAAAPAMRVVVDGNCPTRDELERALNGRGLHVGDSEYTVSTRIQSEQVVMQLIRNHTEVLLTRAFDSSDCTAVAQAAAVVTEAYFVQVGGWLHEAEAEIEPQHGSAASSAVRGSETSIAVQPTASEAEPAMAAGSARGERMDSARPDPGHSNANPIAWNRAPLLGLPQAVGKQRASTPRAIAFAGIGPVLALAGAGISAQLEVGGGFELPTIPFSAELELATSWPSVSGGKPNRVRRWASQGLARVGVPFGNSVGYRPWVGLGATVVELRALDVSAGSARSTLAVLMGGGLELAWPIGARWFGRLDSSCLVLSARESYRVEPDGEIGRGPRVVCSSTVGIRFVSAPTGE